MKKFALQSFVLIVALAVALAAQAPAGGAPGGQGGRGGGGGGAAPAGGGGGGQRGGGGRGGGAAIPAPPAPLQAFADALVASINKQDAAGLTKMLAMDAVYLDEDGHALAPSVWVTKITTGTPAKVFAITGSHGQMLDDNTAWVSFNYTLAETFNNAPKTISGTASLALKKAAGGEWMIQMIHGALTQHVAGMTQ